VSRLGFKTMVQPAERGADLRVIMALGKFHGVIAAHTPIGSLMTTMRLSAGVRNGVAVDALGFLGEPFDEGGAVGISVRASASGLPCSAVRILARSSWFAIISRTICVGYWRALSRSSRARRNAAFAASIARRVSAAHLARARSAWRVVDGIDLPCRRRPTCRRCSTAGERGTGP